MCVSVRSVATQRAHACVYGGKYYGGHLPHCLQTQIKEYQSSFIRKYSLNFFLTASVAQCVSETQNN